MRCRKAGLACQALYERTGRTGAKHPIRKAIRVSVLRRRNRAERKKLEALGITRTQHKCLALD
jgi:transposase